MTDAPKRKPGRPARLDDARYVNLYLDPETVAKARLIGSGSVSDGVRRAVKEFAAFEESTKTAAD